MLTIDELGQIKVRDVEGDIYDDTIGRFIEYAYAGDCTHPNSDVVQLLVDSNELQEALKSASSQRCDEHEWPAPSRMAKKDNKKNTRSAVDFGLWGAESEVVADALEPTPIIAKSENGPSMQEDPAPPLQSTDTDRRNLWISFCSQARSRLRLSWQWMTLSGVPLISAVIEARLHIPCYVNTDNDIIVELNNIFKKIANIMGISLLHVFIPQILHMEAEKAETVVDSDFKIDRAVEFHAC